MTGLLAAGVPLPRAVTVEYAEAAGPPIAAAHRVVQRADDAGFVPAAARPFQVVHEPRDTYAYDEAVDGGMFRLPRPGLPEPARAGPAAPPP